MHILGKIPLLLLVAFIATANGQERAASSDNNEKSIRSETKGSPATWLRGTWRSDRESTIEAWGKYPPGSPKFREIMQRTLGQLEFSYGENVVTSRYDGQEESGLYRIVWQTNDQAFVVFSDPDGKESGQHLHFNSPTEYWIDAGAFHEFFRKIRDD